MLLVKMSLCLFLSSCVFAGDFTVLDMKEYYNESRRAQFVKELSQGFHEVGVVIVTNTGINRELVTRAFAAMEQFFALDDKIKKQYDGAAVNYQRGYLPFCLEKTDYKEVYHFGRDNNYYPKEIHIQDAIAPYFRELEHYMTIFQEAIAIAMGMPKAFFLPMTTGGESLLRALHYPPHLGIWAEDHTDIDLFSIFSKPTLEGLEIKNRAGEWIKVDVPEGGIIVTVGHFLENLSNGYFIAGRQRVISHEKRLHRYALGFFVHPKDDVLLGPLPSMIEKTGGIKRYADLNRRELLMERLAHLNLASYDTLKELAESGVLDKLKAVGKECEQAVKRLEEHGLL